MPYWVWVTMRQLTREQLQRRKEKATRFVRDVLGDPERAEEIAAESLESYAQRRKIQISNPKRRFTMAARKTIEDYREENAGLKDELADAQDTIEALEEQLGEIADIASGEGEEDEEESELGEE